MQPLPKLLDAVALRRELGIGRRAQEAIFRELPKVTIPGHSRMFVRRDDVQKLLDDGIVDATTGVRTRRRRAA